MEISKGKVRKEDLENFKKTENKIMFWKEVNSIRKSKESMCQLKEDNNGKKMRGKEGRYRISKIQEMLGKLKSVV